MPGLPFSGNRFFLSGFVVFILVLCVSLFFFLEEEEDETPEKLVLQAAEFSDFTGWEEDALEEILPAFQKSCGKLKWVKKSRSMGGSHFAGETDDWKEICAKLLALPADRVVIRTFFEKNFTPLLVTDNGNREGLFTGYYEASLKGSLVQSEKFSNPLYLRPDELVMVHLGRFRDSLKGQRIAGHVKNGELVPFADRSDIEKGALENRDLEIVWVDSAVDSFFLHIQGSGRIELDDGSAMRVGYAAQNGHPYFAIGKTLIEEGHVPREKMSMQAIRDWLEKNPDRAQEVMNKNASYIFFRELKTSGPIGAQGVELTAKRSLAVDRKWMPLGVPVWLETELEEEKSGKRTSFNRLMMAQDTGGAIRGPVRGDVFWGHGEEAYTRAGSMKSVGSYFVLLPNGIAKDYLSKSSSRPTG